MADIEKDGYLEEARERYGSSGARDVDQLLRDNAALFAGGELSQEQKDQFFEAVMRFCELQHRGSPGNCAAGLIGSNCPLGNASAISKLLLGQTRLLSGYLDLVRESHRIPSFDKFHLATSSTSSELLTKLHCQTIM